MHPHDAGRGPMRSWALRFCVNRGTHALCLHANRCPLLFGTSGDLEIRVNRCARALCLHVNRCPRLRKLLGTPYLRVNRCARALGLHVNPCPRVLMNAWEDTSLGTSWGPLFTCESKCPCALSTRKSVSPQPASQPTSQSRHALGPLKHV